MLRLLICFTLLSPVAFAKYDPFAKWEKAISSFEKRDAENPPEKGQILFIGSSSIRMWDLDKYFPQVDAINRGFGGSEVADSVHFFDRIVKPYAPRQIVMYAGDNDIAHDKSPEQVQKDFQEFVGKVHAEFPETSIVFVAVKPSISRWSLIDAVRKTNKLIEADCEQNPKLTFFDIDAPMIGEDGTPKKDLFLADGLHLSEKGYVLWSTMLMEHLDTDASPAVVLSEFIYEEAPFPQCHASTIAEVSGKDEEQSLVAAWFGGTKESHPDVGIWVARKENGRWSEPVEVANGVQHQDLRYPTWNPVLFQQPDGPLQLYYKCGPNPREWWGMLTNSTDQGKTWSHPCRLPETVDGPVKNKPVLLADRTLLCGSSTEYDGWRIHFEKTKNAGKTWKRIGPINDASKFNAIQPCILSHKDGKLQILCRAREGHIVTSWSSDQGETWTALEELELPNPNSGIDAVTLQNGTHLLIYNHTPRGRSPLNIAVSEDGINWTNVLTLESEKGEYSYPAIIQTHDGMVHATYTWKRQRVKHVVLDPSKLTK